MTKPIMLSVPLTYCLCVCKLYCEPIKATASFFEFLCSVLLYVLHFCAPNSEFCRTEDKICKFYVLAIVYTMYSSVFSLL